MIGRPDGSVPAQTLWLTGYERTNLGPELARRGARLVADPHPAAELLRALRQHPARAARGDRADGVELRPSQAVPHRRRTTSQHIDFAHMTEAIRSMLEPVRWLANSSFKPQWLPGKKP